MKLVEHFERIKKMNRLIKSGQTGSPSEFAYSLGISQSHLFRCLHELELYGMDIHYSRSLKTYFYGNNSELAINYSLKLIADSKAKEIIGGAWFSKKSHTELHREAQSSTEKNFGYVTKPDNEDHYWLCN